MTYEATSYSRSRSLLQLGSTSTFTSALSLAFLLFYAMTTQTKLSSHLYKVLSLQFSSFVRFSLPLVSSRQYLGGLKNCSLVHLALLLSNFRFFSTPVLRSS